MILTGASRLIAVQLSKAAINQALDVDLEAGLAYQSSIFAVTFSTAAQKEGLTAFQERRQPDFTGPQRRSHPTADRQSTFSRLRPWAR